MFVLTGGIVSKGVLGFQFGNGKNFFERCESEATRIRYFGEAERREPSNLSVG